MIANPQAPVWRANQLQQAQRGFAAPQAQQDAVSEAWLQSLFDRAQADDKQNLINYQMVQENQQLQNQNQNPNDGAEDDDSIPKEWIYVGIGAGVMLLLLVLILCVACAKSKPKRRRR